MMQVKALDTLIKPQPIHPQRCAEPVMAAEMETLTTAAATTKSDVLQLTFGDHQGSIVETPLLNILRKNI